VWYFMCFSKLLSFFFTYIAFWFIMICSHFMMASLIIRLCWARHVKFVKTLVGVWSQKKYNWVLVLGFALWNIERVTHCRNKVSTCITLKYKVRLAISGDFYEVTVRFYRLNTSGRSVSVSVYHTMVSYREQHSSVVLPTKWC
jgi:hypothetical protein